MCTDTTSNLNIGWVETQIHHYDVMWNGPSHVYMPCYFAYRYLTYTEAYAQNPMCHVSLRQDYELLTLIN